MKIGDYVRTKDGLVRKIVEIDKLIYIDKDYISDEPEYHNSLIEEDVIKSSPNIIDLIEIGDYVNGARVIRTNAPAGFVIVNTALMSENTIYKYNIKSIVTKKRFESMKYIVGD